MVVNVPVAQETLGTRLERQRLLHRQQRLTAAVRALAAHPPAPGSWVERPRALGAAIRDFENALAEVRTRLAELGPPS